MLQTMHHDNHSNIVTVFAYLCAVRHEAIDQGGTVVEQSVDLLWGLNRMGIFRIKLLPLH